MKQTIEVMKGLKEVLDVSNLSSINRTKIKSAMRLIDRQGAVLIRYQTEGV